MSLTTYTQSDFDEFEQLFDMEGLDSQPEEYFFGSDTAQERINASFIMRHDAEEIRERALSLEDFLRTLEKHERNAKSILFEADEAILTALNRLKNMTNSSGRLLIFQKGREQLNKLKTRLKKY